MLETVHEALPLVSVVTLVAVIANILMMFRTKRDINIIREQSEIRLDYLHEERERLRVLHEERRLLAEQLRVAQQEPPGPPRSQQQNENLPQEHTPTVALPSQQQQSENQGQDHAAAVSRNGVGIQPQVRYVRRGNSFLVCAVVQAPRDVGTPTAPFSYTRPPV